MGTCELLSIVLDEVGDDEGETGRTQGMEGVEGAWLVCSRGGVLSRGVTWSCLPFTGWSGGRVELDGKEQSRGQRPQLRS